MKWRPVEMTKPAYELLVSPPAVAAVRQPVRRRVQALALLPARYPAGGRGLSSRAVARLLAAGRGASRRPPRPAGPRRQDAGQAHALRGVGHRDAGDERKWEVE